MKRHVLILGVVGGLLITLLKWSEYRFLVLEHSVQIYAGLVAVIFAAFGIWLGMKLTATAAGDCGTADSAARGGELRAR